MKRNLPGIAFVWLLAAAAAPLRAACGWLFAFGYLRCAPVRTARLVSLPVPAGTALRAAFSRLCRSAPFAVKSSLSPVLPGLPRHCARLYRGSNDCGCNGPKGRVSFADTPRLRR